MCWASPMPIDAFSLRRALTQVEDVSRRKYLYSQMYAGDRLNEHASKTMSCEALR